MAPIHKVRHLSLAGSRPGTWIIVDLLGLGSRASPCKATRTQEEEVVGGGGGGGRRRRRGGRGRGGRSVAPGEGTDGADAAAGAPAADKEGRPRPAPHAGPMSARPAVAADRKKSPSVCTGACARSPAARNALKARRQSLKTFPLERGRENGGGRCHCACSAAPQRWGSARGMLGRGRENRAKLDFFLNETVETVARRWGTRRPHMTSGMGPRAPPTAGVNSDKMQQFSIQTGHVTCLKCGKKFTEMVH
ncbi:uncharacterized protein [Narcine bancroftii]|uniref:uncharacterized protein n=1 Tax=Narcine bancroftii TaxID=1343680 RepID=UPI003831591A